MAADVKKTGQFSEMEFSRREKKHTERGSIRKQKQDSAVIENMKVDVPKKQEGGVFSGHGKAESRPLVRILKERERERQVKRKV